MSRSYSTLLSWFGLTIAASLMLYHTSDRVNALGHQLTELNGQIEAEQQSLHVLKAEWVYLANPARIDAAARRHLALLPTAPSRVVAMKDIGSLLPLHDGVEPNPQVEVADASDATQTKRADVSGAALAKPETAPVRPIHIKTERTIAALTTGHINEHMIMPHAVAVEASTDTIGTLISSLSLRP